ncbi:Pkinase-domain-containing protein [Rhodotorula sp. JG-1b]|nr:Pkinase-domain-containing protein [Rhodotorula sp. JG-1b]
MGPPPARRPSERYRASSAAAAPGSGVGVTSSSPPNGAAVGATPRSISSGAAPSSSLGREASLRSSASAAAAAAARAPSTDSHPPSRQASISTNGRSTGGTATDGHDPRDGSRRKAPGGGAGEQGAPASAGQQQQTVIHGARSRRTLGEWQLTKTLGAGSMGKVKLGVSQVTAQQAAAIAPNDPNAANAAKKSEPTASFIAKAAAKDASKEVRTVREGSLCLLLHHPYICGMRELLVYPHHYYFVQEYVNGGQMLDYIIAHGRLRERSARKFARQIGSALEYCHANSIISDILAAAETDLKIENILISKTGNIKIIDFGLSNLYSPTSYLSTFCGSLYFAAPELLNAKPYTGPEVDVWSFGIVLYVLVCGKVPFDDQSMPALHAKIKRGQVEYPAWLSSECKHLLSRMLVTVPTQRATLHEVLNHPWIVKGFPGPPAAHIPPRVPLRFGELDDEVIRGMTGFEFGTEEEIRIKLSEVIESDSYRQAVRNWEAKRNSLGAGDGRSAYNELEPGSAPSTETSFVVNGLAPRPEQLDPTRGFHPLLSIYYLVKEKIERERIWGPGVFASSTLSLTGPPPPPAPAQAYATGSTLVSPPVNVDVRPALPTPPVPSTPQPRQRAMGDFGAMPASAPARPNEYSSANKRASYFGPAASPASPAIPSFRQPNDYEAPGSPTPRERKQSNRLSLMMGSPAADRERDRFADQQATVAAAGDDVPLATISQSPSSPGVFARRFSSLLGKSSPDSNGAKGHRTRASIATSSHKSSTKTAASPLPQVTEAESAKPVWLKGLFSVSTTSTKPIATLRADLIRVLDRLGVQHRDVKNGFECAHVPSIDLSSLGSSHDASSSKDRRSGTVRRRASKLLLPTRDHERPADAAGESDMIVRFEIFLVKMPLLPGIHGLQFRRISGDAWQYQMLARRVLQELKL